MQNFQQQQNTGMNPQMYNQMQRQMYGQMPNQGQMHGQAQGQVPGYMPGQGQMHGQIRGHMHGQMYPGINPVSQGHMQQQQVQNQGQMQQFPGQMQQIPGQMQQMPGQMQQMPGQMQQIPGQMQQFPGQMGQYRGNMMPNQGFQQQFRGSMQQAAMQQQMMPGGRAPPPYEPQMTKEFKAKQEKIQQQQMKQLEKQRQKMEQEFKQRQFQETQKRLKEFSTLGGRKTDVDSAIHSIIGSSASSSKAHAQKQQSPPIFMQGAMQTQPNLMTSQVPVNQPSNQPSFSNQAPPSIDDDFADFKGAPVNQSSSINQQPMNDDFGGFKTAPNMGTVPNMGATPNMGAAPNMGATPNMGVPPNMGATSTQAAGMSAKPPEPAKNIKTDINDMMAKFSDLSAAGGEKKQLKFKPSVKDIQASEVKVETFQASTKARHWSYSEQEQLSNLFVLPQPEQPAVLSAHMQPPVSRGHHPGHQMQVSPGQQMPPVSGAHIQGISHMPPVSGAHIQGMSPGQQMPTVSGAHIQGLSHMPPVSGAHIQGISQGQQIPPVSMPGQQMPVVSISGQNMPAPGSTPGTQHLPPSSSLSSMTSQGPVQGLKWYEENAVCPMPPVYMMVLEACTRDNKIDTHLVFSILMRSGLDKAVLGQLWGLCNKQNPGHLSRHELFMLLAMVAVAQNKMKHDSTDILKHCPYPPIPQFGQDSHTGQSAPGSQVGQSTADAQGGQSACPSQQHQEPVEAFADFQQAETVASNAIQKPPANQAPPPISASRFAASSNSQSMPTITNINAPPVGKQSSASKDDDFADFQAFDKKPASQEEEFADFAQAPPTLPMTASASDLIGQDDKYAALRVDVPNQDILQSPKDKTKSPAKVEDSEEFADFASFDSTVATSQAPSLFSTQGLDSAIDNSQTVDSDVHVKPDSSSSFMDQGNTGITMKKENEPDDFGEFIAKPVNNPSENVKSGGGNDKFSALKALVMDQKLYSEKKPKDTESLETDFPIKETSSDDDLDPFTTSDDKAIKTEHQNEDWDPFTKSHDQHSTKPSFLIGSSTMTSSSENKSEEAEDEWADFSEAPSDKNTSSSGFSGFASYSAVEAKPELVKNKESTESRMSVDPGKANSMFAHNIPKKPAQHIGISALDTEPPEIPDFPDDEDTDQNQDNAFDKFGTFHSNTDFDLDTHSTGNISSLVTPYGGFDDINESSANQKPAALKISHMTNSQSASSFEFTGWAGNKSAVLKEDTQSMKSLDLGKVADSQNGSPNNADSQSVASLDLPAETKKKTTIDAKSVASLDLPASEQVPDSSSGSRETSPEGASQNSSLNSGTSHVKAGSELLSQGGEAPTFGDRYSALFDNEPQESERHIFAWEKCLSQSEAMIQQANQILNNIESMEVLKEVMESERGSEYLENVTQIYRVACRIKTAMHGLSLNTTTLDESQKSVHNSWNNLVSFMSSTALMPSSQSLSFKKALRSDKSASNINSTLCGVCLLDANIVSDDTSSANGKAEHKLSYGGRDYHITCANFWVNCVDSMLPALKIPELI